MPTTNRLWALAPDSAQAVFADLAVHLRGQETPPQAAHPSAYLPDAKGEEHKGYTVQNGVAVIPVNGTITRKEVMSRWTGRPVTAGQDTILDALERALTDYSVTSILLDIDSPGGVVAGTKELVDRVAAAAKVKPMAAYANGLMASAAMWIGAATGRVLAPVTATVGSVGVILVHTDFSKLNEKWGVSYSYITAGKWKAAGNEDTPLSDEERDYFQRHVSQLHEIFKADVVRGLGVTAPADQWAEGQFMLAEEAKAVGLVTTIVRDLASAITTLRLEATMDLKTLAAQHPELLADIQNQARAEAAQTAEAKVKTATEEASASVLAMVKAVAGEEVHARVESLVRAEVRPEQLAAISAVMVPPTAQAQSKEEAAKSAILAGIQAATPPPVAGAAPSAGPDQVMAAIERISKINL